MTLLSIKNLSVKFGEQEILHDVNLAVENKELLTWKSGSALDRYLAPPLLTTTLAVLRVVEDNILIIRLHCVF